MSRLRLLAMAAVPAGALIVNRKRSKVNAKIEHHYDTRWDLMPEHEGTRVLYLVRHGRYDILNPDEEEQWLTRLGKEQLIETGKHLANLYQEHHSNEAPELIISSTMARAIESRDLIMAQFPPNFFPPPKVTDLLRECAVTVPVQRQSSKRYQTDEMKRSMSMGINSLETALMKYCHRGSHQDGEKTAIIVCHANVIRYLLCRLMQVRPNAWLQYTLMHGSVTKVVIKGNGDIRVMAVGECGFMPDLKMVTCTNSRLEHDLRAAEVASDLCNKDVDTTSTA